MTKKGLLIIVIATFITVVSWVFFDILHTRSQVEISPKLQQVIEPIDPNFDQDTIQLLQ